MNNKEEVFLLKYTLKILLNLIITVIFLDNNKTKPKHQLKFTRKVNKEETKCFLLKQLFDVLKIIIDFIKLCCLPL